MINVRIADSKEMNGDYSIFVSFAFDNKIVSIIREFPSRYWNKESKEWELPLNKLSTLIEKLSEYEFSITGDYISLEDKNIEVPNGFEFKTKPFEHQIDGFRHGLQYDRWLLGDEQGLGKTKQVIDIAVAKKLQKRYKHCLIICGVNGLKYNWQEEIETHSNEDSWILGQRFKNGKWKIGTNKDKIDDIKNIKNLSPYFIITNVETLRNTEAATLISKVCKSGEIGIVAIDEIHKCFDYDTEILTEKGYLKIGDIVTKKLQVAVMSYNANINKFEWRPTVNWFENTIAENMLELTIKTASGLKTLKCTASHKIHTQNRGWVCAGDLTENDDITEL